MPDKEKEFFGKPMTKQQEFFIASWKNKKMVYFYSDRIVYPDDKTKPIVLLNTNAILVAVLYIQSYPQKYTLV